MSILKLTLEAGREIWADSFHMQWTYAGLLLGYPHRTLNDRLLTRLPESATRIFCNLPVHVIEPSRRISPDTPYGPDSPYGPAEYLPPYWVAADFTSLAIDDAMDASGLILVWFQEKPFPIPSETALSQLRAVNWEVLSRDFEV